MAPFGLRLPAATRREMRVCRACGHARPFSVQLTLSGDEERVTESVCPVAGPKGQTQLCTPAPWSKRADKAARLLAAAPKNSQQPRRRR